MVDEAFWKIVTIKRCTLYGLKFLLPAPQAGSKLLAMFYSQVNSKINFTKRRNMVISSQISHISAVSFSVAHILLNISIWLSRKCFFEGNISFRLSLMNNCSQYCWRFMTLNNEGCKLGVAFNQQMGIFCWHFAIA